MRLEVRNSCADFNSYRAARVKSLFNAESGAEFNLDAEIPVEDMDWKLGVIVGPSGSGKTSLGRMLFDGGKLELPDQGWPHDAPIVDAIAPGASFDAVTGALSSVGLGDVPAWLRPYHALSNGEKFRASLARVICDRPAEVVIDEFTSVVDRQIAKVGALAFAKSWKRGEGQCVLLSCHYDILDWLEPDWIYDTASASFTKERRRRPRYSFSIHRCGPDLWPHFEPHHYLKLPRMVGSAYYCATVEDEPVAHLAVSTKNKGKKVEARACRLVVMPEWQGAGIGTRFLDAVCELQATGEEGARLEGRKVTTCFHTSHPGLAAALRRNPRWRQLSAVLYGNNKRKSRESMAKSARVKAAMGKKGPTAVTGYGGHFRAVQGFRYYGKAAVESS